MGLRVTASDVERVEEGIWRFPMAPHQVRHFGSPASSVGSRSVMVLRRYEYDPVAGLLHFDVDDAVAINVGTLPEVVGLAAAPDTESVTRPSAQRQVDNLVHGPGDREFIRLIEAELPDDMQRAALALLAGVRRRSAGDLKRGQSRNFSDTPDNFWYVIVQPRVAQLSITVRGPVSHFEKMARLPIKDDRGNTLFKVASEADVPAALDLIFHAKRKM